MFDLVPHDIWYRIFNDFLSDSDIVALNQLNKNLRSFFNDSLLYTRLYNKRWSVTSVFKLDIFSCVDLRCVTRDEYIACVAKWQLWLSQNKVEKGDNLLLLCKPEFANKRLSLDWNYISFNPKFPNTWKCSYDVSLESDEYTYLDHTDDSKGRCTYCKPKLKTQKIALPAIVNEDWFANLKPQSIRNLFKSCSSHPMDTHLPQRGYGNIMRIFRGRAIRRQWLDMEIEEVQQVQFRARRSATNFGMSTCKISKLFRYE